MLWALPRAPWGWPLYPWSLFLLMLVGIGLRSYLFCVSFYPGHQSVDPFGLYFLWPVLLAGAVLMLEMSRVEDQPVLRWVAFGLPLLMLVLSSTLLRQFCNYP